MLINLSILKKIIKNGAYSWILVRSSAILFLLYIIYLLYFIFSVHYITYDMWCSFFSKKITKIFNLVALIAFLIHSWIGISHVLEDYIKCLLLKNILKSITITMFFVYLFCGMSVIWGT